MEFHRTQVFKIANLCGATRKGHQPAAERKIPLGRAPDPRFSWDSSTALRNEGVFTGGPPPSNYGKPRTRSLSALESLEMNAFK